MDPHTGRVLAVSGGFSFETSQFDRATQAKRQPGSSIKPLIYMMAFARDYSPATVIQDAPVTFKDTAGNVWTPQNFDHAFHGNVTARTALGNSLNIPAVKTLKLGGLAVCE